MDQEVPDPVRTPGISLEGSRGPNGEFDTAL